MLIELGNDAPRLPDGTPGDLDGPAVTYIDMPQSYLDTVEDGADISQVKSHIAATLFRPVERSGITRLGDLGAGHLEALLAIAHPQSGAFQAHSAADRPTWVHAPGHPMLEHYLSEFFDCEVGKPIDVEATHHTRYGPPGEGPTVASDVPVPQVQAAIGSGANGGRDQLSATFLGWNSSSWYSGTATASSATSITATGTPWVASALIGMSVLAPAAGVYGVITANTTSVATVDRWYSITNPGGAAGTTPAATAVFIVTAFAPTLFIGLTATATAPATPTTNTVLPGEITTVGGGLIRKIAPVAHTAGTATDTHTPVWTANGTDTLPVTVAQSGEYPVLVYAGMMAFQSPLSVTATLSASGDQLTETVTYSLT